MSEFWLNNNTKQLASQIIQPGTTCKKFVLVAAARDLKFWFPIFNHDFFENSLSSFYPHASDVQDLRVQLIERNQIRGKGQSRRTELTSCWRRVNSSQSSVFSAHAPFFQPAVHHKYPSIHSILLENKRILSTWINKISQLNSKKIINNNLKLIRSKTHYQANRMRTSSGLFAI